MNLRIFLDKYKKAVDLELDKILPKEILYPEELHRSLRFAVFSGQSKRIRPILLIESCFACGGKPNDALGASAAIELIHCYSLVHDDLPAMDDSDTRRGKPALHKKFSEATAILCGDALVALAFKTIAKYYDAKKAQQIIEEISKSIGSFGMIGGQFVDIKYKGKEIDLPTIEYINTHKTGSLIASSLKIGAICASSTKEKIKSISKFGEYLGLIYQIVDDILDKDGISRIIGQAESHRKAKELLDKASAALKNFGREADMLRETARYILERKR